MSFFVFLISIVNLYINIFNIQKISHICVYVIMKTMYPPGYHHNDFEATHALRHMILGYIYGITSYIYLDLYIYIQRIKEVKQN